MFPTRLPVLSPTSSRRLSTLTVLQARSTSTKETGLTLWTFRWYVLVCFAVSYKGFDTTLCPQFSDESVPAADFNSDLIYPSLAVPEMPTDLFSFDSSESVLDLFSDEWQDFFHSDTYLAWYQQALAQGVRLVSSRSSIFFRSDIVFTNLGSRWFGIRHRSYRHARRKPDAPPLCICVRHPCRSYLLRL